MAKEKQKGSIANDGSGEQTQKREEREGEPHRSVGLLDNSLKKLEFIGGYSFMSCT